MPSQCHQILSSSAKEGGRGVAHVKLSLFGDPYWFSAESSVSPMLSPTREASAWTVSRANRSCATRG